MGDLSGIPAWLAETLFLIVFFGLIGGWAWRNTSKTINATLAKRPNPTKEQFIGLMQEDVRVETAEFLWETIIVYLEPKLSPHPDDSLAKDLPIDDDDWSMDWPRDFAERHGVHESNLPDWPAEWPVTVRNFGRWLDLSLPQTT